MTARKRMMAFCSAVASQGEREEVDVEATRPKGGIKAHKVIAKGGHPNLS